MEKKDKEDWVYKGNNFYNNKNYEEAIKCYEKAAQLDPNYAYAFYSLGNALSRLAEINKNVSLYENAFEKYDKAIQLAPNNYYTFVNFANTLSSLAEIKKDVSLYENAFEKYDKATQLNPNDASIFYNWGVAVSGLAKIKKDVSLYENACEKFDKATKIDPNYASAFYNLGIVLFSIAEIKKDVSLYESACEKFDKATKIDLNKISAFVNWGNALYCLAEIKKDVSLYENAFEKYEKAAKIDPNDTSVFVNWGNALSRLAEINKDESLYKSAFEKYEKATKIDPNNASAFYNFGNALSRLAEIKKDVFLYENAFEKYEKATKIDPNNNSFFNNFGNALYNLAEIKKDVSLYENAFEKYDKATQLDPNDASVFYNWGIALSSLAEIKKDVSLYKEAFEKYEKATQLDPNDTSAFYSWGNTLSDLAEINKDVSLYKSAFEKYEKATKINPNKISAFVNWGITFSRLAEMNRDVSLYEDAFKKYDKAAQLDPNDNSAFYNWGVTLLRLVKINKDKDFQKKLKIFDSASEKTDNSDINLFKGAIYFVLYQKEKKQEYENKVKEYFKKSRKSILEILTFLEKDDEEKIIKTEILHSLLDLKTTENGKFFIETIGSQSEEKIKEYKEIYIRSIFIISLLHVNDENEKRVAHYREKNISQKLLFDDTSKFRLNAIDFSNDPSEGKTLLDFLYGKGKNPDDEKLSNEEYEAFAGCFVFDYDNLNMFRLYGKNEHGNEGTGLSHVFKDSFFSKEAKMVLGSPKTDSSDIKNDDTIEKNKLTLFRCIYIDPNPKTKQNIVTVGRKEEYLFYREGIEKKYYKYNTYINKLITLVRKEMKNIKNKARKLDPVIVEQLLLNLRYLVKHVAFKEEQECRILKIHHIRDKEIKITDDYKRMFIEYSPTVSMHIEKIYFGPKAADFDLIKSILKNKSFNITCHKSENPFA